MKNGEARQDSPAVDLVSPDKVSVTTGQKLYRKDCTRGDFSIFFLGKAREEVFNAMLQHYLETGGEHNGHKSWYPVSRPSYVEVEA